MPAHPGRRDIVAARRGHKGRTGGISSGRTVGQFLSRGQPEDRQNAWRFTIDIGTKRTFKLSQTMSAFGVKRT